MVAVCFKRYACLSCDTEEASKLLCDTCSFSDACSNGLHHRCMVILLLSGSCHAMLLHRWQVFRQPQPPDPVMTVVILSLLPTMNLKSFNTALVALVSAWTYARACKSGMML
jgi:hypothetical protein